MVLVEKLEQLEKENKKLKEDRDYYEECFRRKVEKYNELEKENEILKEELREITGKMY